MRPIAILCSDLHFSHVAPSARSAEPSWYAVQKRYLDQLRDLQKRCNNCVIVAAGDIFHGWAPQASPAELINFLIAHLPDNIHAIPGQHDLINHRYDSLERTPYWTLVAAGKLKNIEPNGGLGIGQMIDGSSSWSLYAHGFPWGYEVTPFGDDGAKLDGDIHLAVVHAYIWNNDFGGYPGAPDEQRVEFYQKKLEGYDAAVFGDNHEGRLINSRLINCGTFMRRRSDERNYRPMVGILYSDGTIQAHYLDVSADLWLDDAPSKPEKDQAADTSGVIESLKQLGADALDFRSVLHRLMDQQQTTARVRETVAAVIP